MTHPHAPPEATPHDGRFLRVFFVSLTLLLAGVIGLVLLTDPLGRFGTGRLPPVVSADRDQKASLYRVHHPSPELVVLGSSRSKTLAPSCLERLSGHPAFNFAVNGAGTEDLLAILHFLLASSAAPPRTLLVGLDPEMLQGAGAVHRALEGSRALAPYAPGGAPRPGRATLGADLLGWQAVSAALRSLARRLTTGDSLPDTALDPDGLQRYPRAESALGQHRVDANAQVAGSIPGILGRYESFTGLDSQRVGYLRQFAREAHAAGIDVLTFIPPVHPAFARAAAATAWAPRTRETITVLRELEAAGVLRYVDVDRLLDASPDTTQFVDAIHFLAPVAATLARTLLASPEHCALQ